MDEQHLYHYETFHHWNIPTMNWQKLIMLSLFFVKILSWTKKNISILAKKVIHLIEDSASVQLDWAANNSEVNKQKMTKFDKLKNKLSDLPKERLKIAFGKRELSRQTEQTQTSCVLFFGLISYGSAFISKKLLNHTLQSDFYLQNLDAYSISA